MKVSKEAWATRYAAIAAAAEAHGVRLDTPAEGCTAHRARLQFTCAACGHVYTRLANTVLCGRRDGGLLVECPRCMHAARGERQRVRTYTPAAVAEVEQAVRAELVDPPLVKSTEVHTWRCTVHGRTFSATWRKLRDGVSRCPECLAKHRRAARREPLETYRQVAVEHGLRFIDDSLGEPVERWTCMHCGAPLSAHLGYVRRLTSERGCPKCSMRVVHKEHRLTVDDYVARGRRLGFEYLDVDHRPAHTHVPVHWRCVRCCAVIELSMRQLVRRGRCPECTRNGEEGLCHDLLRELLGIELIKSRPRWLLSDRGTPLELDMFSARFQLAFEYQGAKHLQFTPCFHGDRAGFARQLALDAHKVAVCRQRGVRLVPIPHFNTVPRNTTRTQRTEFLRRILTEYGVFEWLSARGWSPPTATAPSVTAVQVLPVMAVNSVGALPASTRVVTPTGLRSVGELRAGDEVIDGTGRPARLLVVRSAPPERVHRAVLKHDAVDLAASTLVQFATVRALQVDRWLINTTANVLAAYTVRAGDLALRPCPAIELPAVDLPEDPLEVGLRIGALLRREPVCVPPVYLSADAEARTALLRGVIAAGGAVRRNGFPALRVSAAGVAADLRLIAHGLGYVTTYNPRWGELVVADYTGGLLTTAEHRVRFAARTAVHRVQRTDLRRVTALEVLDEVPVKLLVLAGTDHRLICEGLVTVHDSSTDFR